MLGGASQYLRMERSVDRLMHSSPTAKIPDRAGLPASSSARFIASLVLGIGCMAFDYIGMKQT
jgi:hypothetical protein